MIACLWQSSAFAQEQFSLPEASAVSLSQGPASEATQSGLTTWAYLLALNAGSAVKHARTLFIPSDDAFRHLPGETLTILLNAESRNERERLLERGASAEPVSINEIAGRRVQLKTLDGGLLTIDATSGEIHVGDAEAIAVQTLDDGRVIFVLDDILTDVFPEK
jgi:Secreted and surface protein containing fasciclin-like repeats